MKNHNIIIDRIFINTNKSPFKNKKYIINRTKKLYYFSTGTVDFNCSTIDFHTGSKALILTVVV